MQGPFVSDMGPGPNGGVFVQDMPSARPVPPPRPPIKGVPGPTTGSNDADYAPGKGSWKPL